MRLHPSSDPGSTVPRHAPSVLWLGLALLGLLTLGTRAESVRSPDGRVAVTLEMDNGRPRWSIAYREREVVRQGALGIETAGGEFRGTLRVTGSAAQSNDTTWSPVWGSWSRVRDHYHQLTWKLQETAEPGRILHLVVRAYNEGVACRYEVPAQPNLQEIVIRQRLTEFAFASNHTVYQNRNYEYGNVSIATMSRSEGAVTLPIGDGHFVSLLDADRSNFALPLWQKSRKREHTLVGWLASECQGTLPFDTSWEVLLIGERLENLYENRYLVENLNPPCAIPDTSWINPGPAISQIRNARMVTAEMKTLLEFASAHDIPYVEIDHSWNGAETRWTPDEIAFFEKNKGPFWDDKPEWRNNVGGNPLVPAKGWVPFRPKANSGGNYVDLNIPELTAYGRQLRPPVGLCVYVRSALFQEFGGEHPIEQVFAAYEKMGLAGVKPGFTPAGSQQNERVIAQMVAAAARHRLIAVIHDAFLPYGLSRTYPNLVNVEGGAGDEAEPSIPAPIKSLHDVLLPFTRCLMGPFDYTPEIGRKSKTRCHQIALMGVIPGRATLRGGLTQWSPGGEGGPEVAFVEKWPGRFDEVKVTADLGRHVTVAHRLGNAWYVATLGGPEANAFSYPLAFLKRGTAYSASVYADIPGTRRASSRRLQVTCETVLPIQLEPDGGHLMVLEPGRQP